MSFTPDQAELQARMEALGRAVRGGDAADSILQLTEEMVVPAYSAPPPAADAAVEPLAETPPPPDPDPLPSAATAAVLLSGKEEEERPSVNMEALVRAEIRAWLTEHGADILRQVTEDTPTGAGRT